MKTDKSHSEEFQKVQVVRESESHSPGEGISKSPEVLHLFIKNILTNFTCKKVHQREVRCDCNLTLNCFTAQCSILIITIDEPVRVGESVNIKWDLNFVTEPDQIEQLAEGGEENIAHRTRPIKNEDQTMVLTIRDNIDLLEEIFTVFVSVKFRTIKNTSLGDRSS